MVEPDSYGLDRRIQAAQPQPFGISSFSVLK